VALSLLGRLRIGGGSCVSINMARALSISLVSGTLGGALFGSVVRSAARPDSDIDVLVDVTSDAQFSLIDLVAVKDFLEDRLGRKVDVVTRGGLEPAIRDRVLREAEAVF
jgi:uncharacterized protein